MRAIAKRTQQAPCFQSAGIQRSSGEARAARVCELLLRGGIHEYDREGSKYIHRSVERPKEKGNSATFGRRNSKESPPGASSGWHPACGPTIPSTSLRTGSVCQPSRGINLTLVTNAN